MGKRWPFLLLPDSLDGGRDSSSHGLRTIKDTHMIFLDNKHWISKDTLKIITEQFKNLPKMSAFKHRGAA